MTIHQSRQRRPAQVWVATVLLVVLSFLTAVGGYLFNLSGADESSDYVIGALFLAGAVGYLGAALRLPAGSSTWRLAVLALAVTHGLFNAVVKVGMEGETVSLMFVALTAAVTALLMVRPSQSFFAAANARG